MTNSDAYFLTFQTLALDAQNLLTLHPSNSGSTGRPPGDTGPLLRSATVLLHTAWENYVEQIALEGFAHLITYYGADHTTLHKPLRKRLGALKDPWALAGTGWRTQAQAAVNGEAGRLNTPNVENTEDLLLLALGLENALHDISWQKMPTAKVVTNIDEFVHEIRGEIVHKGATLKPLQKTDVVNWSNFFQNLTSRLDEKIRHHIEALTSASPW